MIPAAVRRPAGTFSRRAARQRRRSRTSGGTAGSTGRTGAARGDPPECRSSSSIRSTSSAGPRGRRDVGVGPAARREADLGCRAAGAGRRTPAGHGPARRASTGIGRASRLPGSPRRHPVELGLGPGGLGLGRGLGRVDTGLGRSARRGSGARRGRPCPARSQPRTPASIASTWGRVASARKSAPPAGSSPASSSPSSTRRVLRTSCEQSVELGEPAAVGSCHPLPHC